MLGMMLEHQSKFVDLFQDETDEEDEEQPRRRRRLAERAAEGDMQDEDEVLECWLFDNNLHAVSW